MIFFVKIFPRNFYGLPQGRKYYFENLKINKEEYLSNNIFAENLIDELHLTITDITGGENPISFVELLRKFVIIDDHTVNNVRFIVAKLERK